MKQKIYALRSWVTLLLLGLVSVAWGQTTVSIDFSKQGLSNAQEVSTGTIDDNIKYSFLQGSNSNTPKYYTTGTAVRLYGGGLLDIEPKNGAVITTIKLTYGASNGKSLTIDGKEVNPWTGNSASTITYVAPGTSGHARVKIIEVTYTISSTEDVVAVPVLSPASETSFEGALEVSVDCATEGATIYYTTDGSTPEVGASSTMEYTAPFTITETTTVKAIAVKEGMENSGVATAIYNKVEMLNGIAALNALDLTDAKIDYACKLTDAIVTGVSGKQVYIEDSEAGILLYQSGHNLQVGQKINGVVTGQITLYNGLPELTAMDYSGAEVTEGAEIPQTVVTVAELLANAKKYASMRVQVVDATATQAISSQNGEIEQAGSTIVVHAANTTIKMDLGANVDVVGYPGLYKGVPQLNVLVQEDIVVKGGKEVATLVFPADAYSLNIGEKQTVTATTNSTATIEYASSDESIATVDAVSGEVTAVAAGKVTITARVAENDDFTAAEASYTLTVVDPDAKIEGTALVAPLEGAYYAMLTKAGTTKNTIAAKAVNVVNDKVVLTGDLTIDDLAWVINEAKGTIRTNTGEYLTAASGSTNLNLSTAETTWTYEEGMWKLGTRSFIYTTSGYFKNYAISNIGKASYAYGATVAMPITSGYVRTVTAENFGTICLPNDVAAADFGGAEFYTVAGKRTEGGALKSVVLVEATELKAGVPYIFRATSDKLVAAYSGRAVTAAASENGLQGTLTDVNAAHDTEDTTLEGMYMLTGNKLQLCGKGCWLGANRAYIDMNAVPEADASVKGLEIGLDGLLTGIAGVEADAETAAATVDVYTVSGVRVRSKVSAASATDGLRPGIYLVNGKKVIVK